MKKSFIALLIASLSSTNGAYAQVANKVSFDAFKVTYSGDANVGNYIWGVNSDTGEESKLTTRLFQGNSYNTGTHIVNSETSELWIKTGNGNTEAYNWVTDKWRVINGNFVGIVPVSTKNPNSNCNQVGNGDENILICPPVQDKPKAIYLDDTPLIGKKVNGEIHIGENSLITVEENGVQKLYAKDANGNAIPINITEGTKLLIDGVEVTPVDSAQVEDNRQNISTNQRNISANQRNISANQRNIEANRQNINDLGFGVAGATALSTAMTALPTVADDSPLSCGVGTGGYSSRYAMSVGCAVKASERLSFNAGGSYVFGGAADYGNGSLSNVAGRAGFVFKLGDIQSSPNGDLQARVKELEKANQAMQEENAAIKEQNAAIQSANKELMARLERLEAIASVVLNQNSVASK